MTEEIAVAHRATRRDIRRVYELVEACIAEGEDARAWRTRALTGLIELLRGQVGIGNEIANLEILAEQGWEGVAPGSPVRKGRAGPIRLGFKTPAHRRAWETYADETPTRRTPEFMTLLKAHAPSVTRARRQIWDDASWYRSHAYNERHKPAGIDDSIISICRVPGTSRSSSLWLHREVGASPFGRREWYLLDLAHRELARRIGGALASTLQPSPATLTRRQRETLELLLAGMTEKQSAEALGIKAPTLHEHVQAIYKHFGVHSRSELSAHFLRRYRGGASGPGFEV